MVNLVVANFQLFFMAYEVFFFCKIVRRTGIHYQSISKMKSRESHSCVDLTLRD